MSGARHISFPHNDWHTLDRMLGEMRRQYQRVLLVLEGIYSTDGDIPQLPIIVGDSHCAMSLSQALFQRGINVQPLIYPSVPNDKARLRFFISCTHTEEQITITVRALVEELTRLRCEGAQYVGEVVC